MVKKSSKTASFLEIIGGVNIDKIGGNSSIIEHVDETGKTTRIMTDLGRMFPPYTTDFEMALPDVMEYFDRLDPQTDEYTKALKPVDALFITHAHEDHIGALIDYTKMGYKLPPIYGSRYTCNRIRVAFNNEGMPSPSTMTHVKHREEIKIGDHMTVEAQTVSHSIIGAMGYMTQIKEDNKPEINLINNGDFFVEEDMPIGDSYSREDFIDLIKRKSPTYFLVDSTSISSTSKKRIGFKQALANRIEVIERNPDCNVIVSPVISNSNPNISLDADAARHLGTKICLDGKGLTLMYKAMQMSGYKDFDDVIYKGKIGKYMTDKNIKKKYIVNTGGLSQGLREYKNNQALGQIIPLSSAVKMALGLHSDVTVNKDMLLMACQGIINDINGDTGPEMLQLFASQGAKVVMTPRDKKVANFEEVQMQDTGHILPDELFEVLSDIKQYAPNCRIIPIHGNRDQCAAVEALALKAGLKTHITENTDYINLETDRDQPAKKKQVFNWIGIKALYRDPLHPDDSIPPQGKREYWRIDEYFQELEKIGEADNVRVYNYGDKDYYHVPGGEYLNEMNEDLLVRESMNKAGKNGKISRKEKGDKKTRADRKAEKREELKRRKAEKAAKEQARIMRKMGKDFQFDE